MIPTAAKKVTKTVAPIDAKISLVLVIRYRKGCDVEQMESKGCSDLCRGVIILIYNDRWIGARCRKSAITLKHGQTIGKYDCVHIEW